MKKDHRKHGKQKDKNIKKDKKHEKKAKKHKHKEGKHKKDGKHKKKDKEDMYFATDVDTEKRLCKVLTDLADCWEHKKKEAVLRWLAGDVRREVDMVKKGTKDKSTSVYCRQGTPALPIKKGDLEALFVARLLKLSDNERRSFFERRLLKMSKDLELALSAAETNMIWIACMHVYVCVYIETSIRMR